MNAPDSLDVAIDYFIDSLTGKSAQTKEAYYKDLLQFKLYLVLHRPHAVTRGTSVLRRRLKAALDRSRGRLIDRLPGIPPSDLQGGESSARALLDRFDCALASIGKEDIVAYFGYLENGRRLSRNTLSRRASSLRRFCRLLIKEGYPVAPAVLEKLEDLEIRSERKLPVFLEEEEAASLLDAIENVRDRAMVAVMIFMGLRISEVIQLNVEDIEPETQGITFRGKGGKERYVPLHPLAHQAVLDYQAVRPEVRADEQGGVPLFVSNHRRRIDPSTVRRFLKQYAQKVGTDLAPGKRRRLSPHKLRHTFATLLLQGDVDIRYIQELLGHENLSTTQIYTSVRRRDLHVAISRHPLGRRPGVATARSDPPPET